MKIKITLFTLALGGSLLGALAAPSSVTAETTATAQIAEQAQREQIMHLLSAIHELPKKPAFLSITDDAHLHLIEIVEDEALLPQLRYRALEALGSYWPSPAVRDLYIKAIEQTQHEPLRHRAMMMGAPRFGDDLVPTLAKLLDGDLQLSLTAIEALSVIDSTSSRRALQRAKEAATQPLIKKRIDAALTRVR